MNVRVRILKQTGKNEMVIVVNKRELMRKNLSAILEESDETEDRVLTVQCVSMNMEKVIIWIDLALKFFCKVAP